MRNLGVLAGEVRREYLEPDIDHARRRGEQVSRNVPILFDHPGFSLFRAPDTRQASMPLRLSSRSALSFHTSICTILPPRTTKRSTERLPSTGVPSGHSP